MTEQIRERETNGHESPLAAQIAVVKDLQADTFLDRSRQLDERIAKLECALAPLADRRREVERFFRSVQQDAAGINPAVIEASFNELRANLEALRNEIAELKQDVAEAVTYLGVASNTRFNRMEAASNHIAYRTGKLEEHASFVTDTLRRYLNIWPLSLVRGLRRKIRRLPDTPLAR